MNTESPDFAVPGADWSLAEALIQMLDGQPPIIGGVVEPPDPAELHDLAVLGLLLEAHAGRGFPSAQPEIPLDPAFSARLRARLLAAHPAPQDSPAVPDDVPSPIATSPFPASRQRAVGSPSTSPSLQMQVSWWRAVRYRLWLVGVPIAALIVALLLVLQSTVQQPTLHGALAVPTARSLFPSATARRETVPIQPVARLRTAAPQPSPRTVPPTPAVHAALAAPRFTPAAPLSQGVLPMPLPALPARVPLYMLRARPLTSAQVAAILAGFPGMTPAAGVPGSLSYRGSQNLLRIVPSTGTVTYTTPLPASVAASTTPTTTAAALRIARVWLQQHHLYPAGVDPAATTVITSARTMRVAFVPRLPSVPAGGRIFLPGVSPPVWLLVVLDPAGHVTSARLHWPRLTVTGTAALAGLPLAMRAASPLPLPVTPGVPAGPIAPVPVFSVTTIRLVYLPYPATGDVLTLRPAYLLGGTLRGAPGAARRITQLVPATAAAVVAATPQGRG